MRRPWLFCKHPAGLPRRDVLFSAHGLLVALCILLGSVGATNAASAATPAETFRATDHLPTVPVGESHYLDVAAFLARYNLSGEWIEPGKRQRFASAWTTIVLEVDSREIEFNGLRLFMGLGTVVREGRIWIDRIDAEKLLAPLLRPATYADSLRPVKRIVIDAGHGGKDGGTAHKTFKLQEKTFALDVAKRLKALLTAQGFEVVMTREDDTYIGLAERALIGQQAKADLFVSVHFNAAGRESVRGTETYICTPQHQRSTSSDKDDPSDHTHELGNGSDPWNAVLGYQMHRSLQGQIGSVDRGLKRARFAVLRLAKCPAVLVESAYLTNDAEARRIASPEFRAEIARAIANGVVAYANLVLSTQSS
ncbi:N-acetylmuramoyl-L-alanine amidase family protein [Actomonas aquatica]|uniref:N-acetylmuramoyl-L-alanine amidase n=1 Tax=Actomonas aquatica TaxID=2866162 RepID=A0ABZ1CC32_9BACT|nr:N-acetylmuramoyl-L-alanine amidase [Opitutus sp. WL0086]WRQ89215.1 N-acetylmuramoyl-L-alanine amidase [Opitutus sp. WL0086]